MTAKHVAIRTLDRETHLIDNTEKNDNFVSSFKDEAIESPKTLSGTETAKKDPTRRHGATDNKEQAETRNHYHIEREIVNGKHTVGETITNKANLVGYGNVIVHKEENDSVTIVDIELNNEHPESGVSDYLTPVDFAGKPLNDYGKIQEQLQHSESAMNNYRNKQTQGGEKAKFSL